jgi:hypothetical protein
MERRALHDGEQAASAAARMVEGGGAGAERAGELEEIGLAALFAERPSDEGRGLRRLAIGVEEDGVARE